MTKILIANRGEIAVRIIRACRELGLASVAVYSECDRTALHVRSAAQAVFIGASPPTESYLRIGALIDAARRTGADAVHPGYGLLAENAEFARACLDAGLVFIGPSPDVIEKMGSKTAARAVARVAGVAVVPGSGDAIGPEAPETFLRAAARDVGYPLLVKAVAGGGGKGMRLVAEPEGLTSAVRDARSEALSAFGDAAVYFERQIVAPRHVEVQILADRFGTVVPFVERECSIQRRHQKLIEETPSVAATPEIRRAITEAAARIAREAGYTNAGTIEFLLDADGRFHFLEMNTRLQVEHPITELVSGIDLVHWQFRLARGERLTLSADETIRPRGHALECRIYAEDPDARFMPSPGRITALTAPGGPWVRNDSGVEAPADVPIYYDSLISKLVVWGEDRGVAVRRMRRALDEYEISGIKTTIPFFQWMLAQPEFVEGRVDTGMVDRILALRNGEPFRIASPDVEDVAAVAAALHHYLGESSTDQPGAAASNSAWLLQARHEALR